MYGSGLIGNGSFGCVFRPLISCKGNSNKTDDTRVSKIFFGNDSKIDADIEFELSRNIDLIDPDNKWSYSWDTKCKSPPYEKIFKKDKMINKCLKDANIDIERFDRTSYMLTGAYAGKVINETRETLELKKCYTDIKQFRKIFLKIMKYVKPLFLGLSELYKHKISHLDINRNNMTFQYKEDKLFRYIDFGLSCKFNELDKYENRSKSEFGWERIYPPYPLEFIYLFAPPELLKEELKDIESDIHRTGFDMFLLIHELVFHRNDMSNYQKNLLNKMKNKKPNKNKVLQLLDTYSLGVFIARMLLENKPDNVTKKEFIKLLTDPIIKEYINLFKKMSEPDSNKRILPQEAYDIYLDLEKKYIY